ncbi:radical SAM family heme chaperone HemW [Anaerovorax odorimutans]|uniref:radical SAM family heme chaperone HemW n=1 Tax=Anaerovorax odorimutans TaxID=109327 RepID=UPI0004140F8F|nr:radical SAM family heme chaperone HemW [Anaerovorax odorimutans]
MKNLGIYIHIPFCIRKCNYCDFVSFGGSLLEDQIKYFNVLKKELEYYGKVYDKKFYVDTIFIGGGTPSLVNEALIAELMTAVRANFNIKNDAEITIESNPKTLSRNKLNTYLQTGINRLSIGVQSLNQNLLNYMGRVYEVNDVFKSYSLARDCGFKNINMDLMFAVPNMDMIIWKDTLQKIIKLQPEHISFYSLQLEEGTPFFRDFQEGNFKEIPDELDRQMYELALDFLILYSYNHYEISNAAKMGFECKHNLKYWSLDNYLGIGLGAHSYINGIRFSNTKDFNLYNSTDVPILEWQHKNSEEDDICEYIITGMRKIQGIDLYDFEQRFKKNIIDIYGEEIDKFIKGKLLKTENGKLRFTRQGINISNKILAEFV